MKEAFIKIHPEDAVAVATQDAAKDTEVSIDGTRIVLRQDIPVGHKVALRDMASGESVIKYGTVIGHATQPIYAGDWVHMHNMDTNLSGQLSYTYNPHPHEASPRIAGRGDCFQGYRRADGRVGTRNELWIIPTVSCVNTTIRLIQEEAQHRFPERCDGIFAFPHNAGCSQMGEDFQNTQNILKSIIQHPNAGGVLIVSLGCENNDLEHFLPVLGPYDSARIKTLITQDVEDEVEVAMGLIGQILDAMAGDHRETCPVSDLTVAFKCGGSDAFSGITANPLCGRIADTICAKGGSAVLTEVPEMFGAETYLMNRADNEHTFEKVVHLINGFKQYYADYGQPCYDNPSPGNHRGGITTLEEKSMGCIQKGGNAPVVDTLHYGQRVEKKGLNLMIGPGNDNVSITNLLASGAQQLLFTTGRGNPLATAIPTIKLASNAVMANRKHNWIDFNAGQILEGMDFEDAADELWQMLLDVASGSVRTKNEINGYREVMIFKDGVLL